MTDEVEFLTKKLASLDNDQLNLSLSRFKAILALVKKRQADLYVEYTMGNDNQHDHARLKRKEKRIELQVFLIKHEINKRYLIGQSERDAKRELEIDKDKQISENKRLSCEIRNLQNKLEEKNKELRRLTLSIKKGQLSKRILCKHFLNIPPERFDDVYQEFIDEILNDPYCEYKDEIHFLSEKPFDQIVKSLASRLELLSKSQNEQT